MSQTPFASLEGLLIGTINFVSPDKITILLNLDAPESVALNAGGVRPFPRVNGYVLIPIEDAFLVAQIEWLTIEHSNFPKRRGVQDFGVVDLPYPLRKMGTNPVGTLRKKMGRKADQEDDYTFTRGADALPSVGGSVLLPTEKQLRAIVESGKQRRVCIGTSPLAGNASVCIDPDRLFGRHLAVLGNTGSGKSCSVAGLVRWSLDAAKKERKKGEVNARFIIIDPNGEYTRAFNKYSGLETRVFEVESDNKSENKDNKKKALKVPMWLWNTAEWVAFTQASDKTQRPAIVKALREVKLLKNPITFGNDMLAFLNKNLTGNSKPFLTRVENLLTNERIKAVTDDSAITSKERWLKTYFCNGITILNLSLVPSEIIHIVTTVVARIVFETLQRYRKINGNTLPTALVMEEAHTFIKRYKFDADNIDMDTAAICCQVFERIAREGRKFGLGLVLSSQRPSELSPTVLSQCNTFLLHRMSNDHDQDLVSRFVPDNLRGLLKELPTLPSQQAILLGWASELPILTRMRDLPEPHRPQSEDPDFWSVWTGENQDGEPEERKVDWGKIAKDWQGTASNDQNGTENK